jgi:hypothetical protein
VLVLQTDLDLKALKEELKCYIEKNNQLAKLFKESDVKTNDVIDDSKPLMIADDYKVYYRHNRELENKAQLVFLEHLMDDKACFRILEDSFDSYCCKMTEGFMQVYPMKSIVVRTIFSYLEVMSFLKGKGLVNHYLIDSKETKVLLKALLRYPFFDKDIVPGVEFKGVSVFSTSMRSRITNLLYKAFIEPLNNHAHLPYITDLDRTVRYWYQERNEVGLQEALSRETEIDTIRLDELFPKLEITLP